MKRFFSLAVFVTLASFYCASSVLAQSGRAKRTEPAEERAEKSEQKEKGQGAAKTGEDRPLTGKEVTVRAVITSRPNPGYPPEARRQNVQGVVRLRIILGADGRVRDEMEVLEGLPLGVTEEAIRAARQIEFEPAQKDGRAVSQYVTVVYNFRLY
ncbi:MAG TPA: energy transducer TonB [Pyrinomonadaceae bacterium]|nr:energy transducer TonB [Pyrinomonadaceae bacterium]